MPKPSCGAVKEVRALVVQNSTNCKLQVLFAHQHSAKISKEAKTRSATEGTPSRDVE